jgi:hypothetical protein
MNWTGLKKASGKSVVESELTQDFAEVTRWGKSGLVESRAPRFLGFLASS